MIEFSDGRVLDFDDLDRDEDGILTGYEVQSM